jgi:hypothetical protein
LDAGEECRCCTDSKFVATDVPKLTRNFAGIGTRKINANGLKAIRDVYENTVYSPEIKKAISHSGKLSDVHRTMFKADPEGFLRFAAQQYWGMKGTRKTGEFDFTPGTGLDSIPDEIMDIAKEMFPKSSFISPEGLPPIEPKCD